MAPARDPRPADDDLAGLDHPGLLTSALLARSAGKRTARDWTIDATIFVVAVLGGVVITFGAVDAKDMSEELGLFNLLVGPATCVLLWWRRRWPVQIALVTTVTATIFPASAGASIFMLFALAVYRPLRIVIPFALITTFVGTTYDFYVDKEIEVPLWQAYLWSGGITVILVVWGMFIRARRQLVLSLRERAERAESEQRLLAEQARHAERARIAREMHDVLAHRVSMIALQAGGLEVRPDLPPAELQRTAGQIRQAARRALEELRDVIGVLRAESGDGTGDAPQSPQPALSDIPKLVEEARTAGADVTLDMEYEAAEGEEPPGPVGRAAYRIVQEALTNVNKHAKGARTTVRVDGVPGERLVVVVRNRNRSGRVAAPPELPGAGAGLVGLAERVALSGGTLVHGPTPDGYFEVRAEWQWDKGTTT